MKISINKCEEWLQNFMFNKNDNKCKTWLIDFVKHKDKTNQYKEN